MWNNDKEAALGNKFERQLPDKKSKSNRIDRNIVVTAINQKISIILHENPKDFDQLKNDNISFIDITKLKSLNDFIQTLSNPKD